MIREMVCSSGVTLPPHLNPMTNIELTLDQLQAISGGATAIEYGLMAAFVPNPDKAELDQSSTKKEFNFGLTQPHY